MTELINWIPPWVWIALVAHGAVLGTVAYLILLERKIASWVQDRLGPNRVGRGGLLQPMADGLKFFLKEDYRAAGTDKILFSLAPMIMMAVVIITIAVIPWGGTLRRTVQAPDQNVAAVVPHGAKVVAISNETQVTYEYAFQVADLNIGVLFIIAALSLAVYGIVVGGWASNNKFAFLGALRATAQMVSYEIPLGLSLLTVVLMFGTLDLGQIVEQQAHLWGGWLPAWNVFAQPIAFILFLVCIHAEANRAPFDLAEAEQELVGGYHTEYSSMRFALFFMAEYAGMVTTSAVCVALFFGGWHLPGLSGDVDPARPAVVTSLGLCLLRSGVFFVKTVAILAVFMWVRWSLPRFRFDQLMMLTWRGMIPLSLATVLATGLVIWYFRAGQAVTDTRLDGRLALSLLAANAVLLVAAVILSRILPAPPPTNRRLAVPGSRYAVA